MTQPFVSSGDRLIINAACGKDGYIKVDVLDGAGQVLAGRAGDFATSSLVTPPRTPLRGGGTRHSLCLTRFHRTRISSTSSDGSIPGGFAFSCTMRGYTASELHSHRRAFTPIQTSMNFGRGRMCRKCVCPDGANQPSARVLRRSFVRQITRLSQGFSADESIILRHAPSFKAVRDLNSFVALDLRHKERRGDELIARLTFLDSRWHRPPWSSVRCGLFL